MPPNIFRSLIPARVASSVRTRSASAWSYGIVRRDVELEGGRRATPVRLLLKMWPEGLACQARGPQGGLASTAVP